MVCDCREHQEGVEACVDDFLLATVCIVERERVCATLFVSLGVYDVC